MWLRDIPVSGPGPARHAVLSTFQNPQLSVQRSYHYAGTLNRLISFVCHSYENTGGVGVFFPFWNEFATTVAKGSRPQLPSYQQLAPVTPLEATFTGPLVNVADKRLITSLESTLTETPSRNPFRCNIYKKHLGAESADVSPSDLSSIPANLTCPASGLGTGSTVNFVSRYTELMGILRRLTRWMGKQEQMTNIVAGNFAPNFSLKSLDGKEYALNQRMERGPVVAAFFKISCPVSQFTFPFLERLYTRYGGDGVTFLGISQDDARATESFAREYGVTFPMVIDDENGYLVSNAYGLTNVPTIFLIDTKGKVKISSMGFDKKDLETIAAELAERKKIALAPLFRADEVVPANKPG